MIFFPWIDKKQKKAQRYVVCLIEDNVGFKGDEINQNLEGTYGVCKIWEKIWKKLSQLIDGRKFWYSTLKKVS